ncbi:transmembrane 220 family protein [Adhaeribacter aquaticus]|uniref:transmembrane 220 family protein n=1 Tax=Adhaeribacter aquaticus TaxID=299567 RepID=UPI00040A2FBD|nr:transmembrane 220 family protein [Adhaeribacter aquaticus]
MKIFALIMAFVFVSFAALQYNDPDPYIWIPIYLYVAALSYLAFKGKIIKPLFMISALSFLVGAIFMWPEQWEGVALKNGMKTIFIEQGRESLGLSMCFVTLVIYLLLGMPLRKVAQ